MLKAISQYTAGELRIQMANAKKRNRDDVYQMAFRQLCALEGLDQTDPLYRDFYQSLAAYEQLLAEKNGRKQPASYTRRKVKNKGIIQCLEDWAIGSTQTDGFTLLVELGMPELTGEFLVVKYPDRFSEKAVAAAKGRLGSLSVTEYGSGA
jgi:hypothetical protein